MPQRGRTALKHHAFSVAMRLQQAGIILKMRKILLSLWYEETKVYFFSKRFIMLNITA